MQHFLTVTAVTFLAFCVVPFRVVAREQRLAAVQGSTGNWVSAAMPGGR